MKEIWIATVLRECPEAADHLSNSPHSDSDAPVLALQFELETGELWSGCFSGLSASPLVENSVFPWVSADKALVAAYGQGYVVDVASRTVTVLPVEPITKVLTVDHDAVILADFIRLFAYDSDGLRWRTRRISYDGFWNIATKGEVITGLAWSAPRNRKVAFEVSVISGDVTGGDAPDDD